MIEREGRPIEIFAAMLSQEVGEAQQGQSEAEGRRAGVERDDRVERR
jgi:hypothetical protein